jgi:hypothetical protein
MSKINITSPVDYDRVAPASKVPIIFTINFLSSITTSTTVKFQISDTKDFIIATDIIPTLLYVNNNSAWIEYTNGANILTSDIGKEFKCEIDFPNEKVVKFIRVVSTENGVDYESFPVLISSVDLIDIQLDPPIPFPVRPIKIKVKDKKTIDLQNSGTVSIKVEVCNNIYDPVPTWEDMTTEYTNGDFHLFANKLKLSSNWGISVKYTISKSNYATKVEIDEIYVGFF